MNSVVNTHKIEPETIIGDNPSWIVEICKRQDRLNKRYERAHAKFASAYNDFLDAVGEVNCQFGTTFCLEQALTDFEGMEPSDDDDDE